jgi:hypothetical protein
MPRWLKLILGTIGAVLCVVVGLFLYTVWYGSDTRAAMEGRSTARRMVAQGQYRFISAGLMMTSNPAATGHSRDQYGIEYRNIGCSVTSASEAYRKAYDETMRRAVIKRFGRDVSQDKNLVTTYLPY